MIFPKSELYGILQEFNPWWQGRPPGNLPPWERAVLRQISAWTDDPKSRRALLLSGARQVGKTTLFRQAIKRLLGAGRKPEHILYVTFDHPVLRLAGLERTLEAWRELFAPSDKEPEFLFLDEIQYVPDWQVWLKHQVDFTTGRKIAVTGSAMSLRDASAESGVGRWETIPLPTLSFGEFLRLRQTGTPDLPEIGSLRSLFEWTPAEFARVGHSARSLTAHFHDYLLRSGFPEAAQTEDLTRTQRLLREDIVDKVLRRDMTAVYGVRRVLELENLFLYLCYHDGGILDIPTLCRELGSNRALVSTHLDLLEATHLLYRLRPFGYGKEVLRGRQKAYLADAAIPGAVLLLGRKLLERPDRLGAAVETTFFKHVFTRYYSEQPLFSYWRDKREGDVEVDLIAQIGERVIPFEVKYRDRKITPAEVRGLVRFMQTKSIHHGYVICRRWEDFGILDLGPSGTAGPSGTSRILSIPAPLACTWLSG